MVFDEKKYDELKKNLENMKNEKKKEAEQKLKDNEKFNTEAGKKFSELKKTFDADGIRKIGRRLVKLAEEELNK